MLGQLPKSFLAFLDGPFSLAQFTDGGFPRARWAHLRLELDYRAPAPSFLLRIDDADALRGALTAVPPTIDHATLVVGAVARGTHPRLEAHIDDLRVTSY